ncbi:3-hydroxyisobutyrate dehydrogenase-like beta-hydroxyacid dehydrogenase [Actinocorallia herbida]|uniref:3-hydroxyisobutyrate dehydrogenase-like beta-hydroxyacid dehydrogenase n=1 Tax=Actinocorallia herbida TaxID=58109 RepID=A0A3N1D0K4_9ACTN|nr:NAD(P)-dependent oxidoreductase [Actinocorallia herbida]ROO86568.1 3-hydroxyisobutyrate dehydrogenase-like beta-hydroxyacid dehydrogenase [Actinocorallia herbida]
MSDVASVGFIGLGSQGAPMARRIIEAGFPTTLWARRPETLEPFADTAASIAVSPAEVGAASDLACVCVLDDAGVEEVVSGPNGLLEGMRPGGVIAVHSTVHPETCARLAERAAERGVGLVDAPVSGGGPAAEVGSLLVMAAGEAGTVERCRPVFATYGDPIVHLGPVGAGQRAKLINNLLLAANLGVAESAFALARELGVDPAQLAVVLSRGSGSSFATGMLPRAGFVLAPMGGKAGPLLQKDARIVAELAEANGVKASSVFAAADAALESMGCAR